MPTPNPKTAILLIDRPDGKGIVARIVAEVGLGLSWRDLKQGPIHSEYRKTV
jgi:hypothetical protein